MPDSTAAEAPPSKSTLRVVESPWEDLLDVWLEYSAGVNSPEQFKLWSGISMIAGALERRVWACYGDYIGYPNLYIMLVAAPGVGKFVIEEVRELMQLVHAADSSAAAFHVASDSLTKAAMVDELAAAKKLRILPQGPPLIYHALFVPFEELQFSLPGFDPEFVGTLNTMFNNKLLHRERRRWGQPVVVEIEKPVFNLLLGAQPSYLASTFPEDTWNTGIARRLIMVYSPGTDIFDIFSETRSKTPARRAQLLSGLSRLSGLYGQMKWEKSTADRVRDWHLAGGPPVPTHSRLVHYKRSRTYFIIKLMMVAATAARFELVIRNADFDRALAWLTSAEALMPDIFRDMVGKSDLVVIDELYQFVKTQYQRNRNKPVLGQHVKLFLLDRVPSAHIEGIVKTAEATGVIAQVAGLADMWIPKRPPREQG